MTKQIINNFVELGIPLVQKCVVPFVTEWVSSHQKKAKEDKEDGPTSKEEGLLVRQMKKTKDLPAYQLFYDYLEIVIQFGYVAMFGIAFPLAPMLALVNNHFEKKVDLLKICTAW